MIVIAVLSKNGQEKNCMSDRIFIDTNLLIYAFDTKNLQKQTIAKRLLKSFFDKDGYFISTQVVNEFCYAALRKFCPPLGNEVLREFVSSLPSFKIVHVGRDITLAALSLMDKYSLSYWDSLITATAIANNCTLLHTEDLQDGLVIEKSLRVANPFYAAR